MYVYDQAHVLAKAIRDTNEYKVIKEKKEKIEKDAQLKKMFTDYRTKQFEIQKAQLVGHQVPDEMTQSFKALHEIIIGNPVLKDFLEAEHHFSTMMADIQRILVEGLELS